MTHRFIHKKAKEKMNHQPPDIAALTACQIEWTAPYSRCPASIPPYMQIEWTAPYFHCPASIPPYMQQQTNGVVRATFTSTYSPRVFFLIQLLEPFKHTFTRARTGRCRSKSFNPEKKLATTARGCLGTCACVLGKLHRFQPTLL